MSKAEIVETSGSFCSIKDRYHRFSTNGFGRNIVNQIQYVYPAFDYVGGADVIWKITKLNESFTHQSDHIKLYKHYQKLKDITHPNLCKIMDMWINPHLNTFNVITEKSNFYTLYSYFKRRKLNIIQLKRICKQILTTLSFIHSHNMIHSQLTLYNIFIDKYCGGKMNILLQDFVNLYEYSSYYRDSYSVGYNEMRYMDPAVYTESGHNLGPSADIYAFGFCLLELITSKIAYNECRGPFQVYQKKANGQFPQDFYQIHDAAIRDFIAICWNENPRMRPTAKELLDHPFLEENKINDCALVEYCVMPKFKRFCHLARQKPIKWMNAKSHDLPLELKDINEKDFPSLIVTSLKTKKKGYQLEYVSFIQTQVKLFKLKWNNLQSIRGQMNDGQYCDQKSDETLIEELENKIKIKQIEVIEKWEELLKDEKEIIMLRKKICKLYQTDKVKSELITIGWIRRIQKLFSGAHSFYNIPKDIQYMIYSYYWLRENWHHALNNNVIIDGTICKTTSKAKFARHSYLGGTVYGMNVINGGCHKWVFKTSNILYKQYTMNVGIERLEKCLKKRQDRVEYAMVFPFIQNIKLNPVNHNLINVKMYIASKS